MLRHWYRQERAEEVSQGWGQGGSISLVSESNNRHLGFTVLFQSILTGAFRWAPHWGPLEESRHELPCE